MTDLEQKVETGLTKYIAKEVAMGAATGWLPEEYAVKLSDEKRALARSKIHVSLEYVAAAGALVATPVLGIGAVVVGGALALDAIVRSVDIDRTGTASGSIYAKLVDYGAKGLSYMKDVGKKILYDLFTPARIKEKHQKDESLAESEERLKYATRVAAGEALGGLGLLACSIPICSPITAGIGLALLVDGYIRVYVGNMAILPVELGHAIAKGTHYVGSKVTDTVKNTPKMITGAYKEIEAAAVLTRDEEIKELEDGGHLSFPEQVSGGLSLVEDLDTPVLEEFN